MSKTLFDATIWPAFCTKLRSEACARSYHSIAADFMNFCGGLSFELCNKEHAFSYDKYLARLENGDIPGKKIKHSTHVTRICVLRSISNFIQKCNFVPGYENPFESIFVMHNSPELSAADVPLIEDVDVIFAAAKSNPRDFLIFTLAGKCGLSTSQICGLHMMDLTYNEENHLQGLTIRKGKFSHVILLPDDGLAALHAYLDARASESEFLFTTSRNTKATPRYLQRTLKDYVSALSSKLHCTQLTLSDMRHIAVICMRLGGASNSEIASYMGTVTPAMYDRYSTVATSFMDDAVDYSVLSVRND